MSEAKRRKPYAYPVSREAADRQESIRAVKLEVEHLKEKLQRTVIDHPQFAKKAALLLSLWIEGKERKVPKKKVG